jgi:tricarballylate dehydrogenase
MSRAEREADVVVVGAGNAALCAALAAAEQGARVVVLERAPEQERGGNSAFTGGAMRVAFDGERDVLALVPDLTEEERASSEFGRYSEQDFYEDLAKITEYRADPDLAYLVSHQSLDTLRWMREKGVTFQPSYGRQAFKVGERFVFWGGLAVEAKGGGPGLVDALMAAVDRAGIPVRYRCRATGLLADDDGVHGVRVREEGTTRELTAGCVVLACGGFEANAEWRCRYLGPGWDLAKVRGTRFNTGDGIRMALEAGALPHGNWSGCHAVAWDQNAPPMGDLSVGDGFQKHSYPFGVMVNAEGRRFVDEGADFRNYTYAKYGKEILRQPGQVAWQIFDAKVASLLRDEYRIRQVTRVTAGSIEELSGKLEGVNGTELVRTIEAYNDAVDESVPFDPNRLDGRGTVGITPPKSNWANPLDTPPFVAYAVTCGITFTFGGLRINPDDAQVIDTEGQPIGGLYACGELVGGLFYFNYPGGAGLTSGAVLGRMAGTHAGRAASVA